MKLRWYAATTTGCLAWLLTLIGLWTWTSIDLPEILFWAVTVYLAAIWAVLWATEPKKDRARKHDTPQFYDLREGSDGRN